MQVQKAILGAARTITSELKETGTIAVSADLSTAEVARIADGQSR
ncbi:hypothetical protein ACIBQ1_49010 [Nonomuraea sp. NPDC050153]